MRRIRRFAHTRQPALTATVLVAIGLVVGAGIVSTQNPGVTLNTSLSNGSGSGDSEGGGATFTVEPAVPERNDMPPVTIDDEITKVPKVSMPTIPDGIELPAELRIPEGIVVEPGLPIPMPDGAEGRHPLVVSVATDQPYYRDGNGVKITADVCNISGRSQRYETHRAQELRVAILDEAGQEIAHYFTPGQGAYVIEWEPGECKEFGPFTWWQDKHHFTGEPVHGAIPARPGAHTARVTFAETPVTADGARPRFAQSTEGSARFELDGVTVDVATDKPSDRDGETVVATARVCNPTDRPQAQTFAWDPEAEFRIHRDGHTVAQSDVRGPV
ncbi:MAG TPA: hypothetical protein VF230_03490, partial [Acidimicrobiales bacterium]